MAKQRGRKAGIKTVVPGAATEASPSPLGKATGSGTSMRISIGLRDVLPVMIVDTIDEVRRKYKSFKIIEGYHSDDDDNGVGNGDTTRTYSALTPHGRAKRTREFSATVNTDAPRPRQGWAKQALREDTPYSLLQRRDLFERCPYMMNHNDYVWCHTKGIPNTSFAVVITKLERNYAKYILQYARGPMKGNATEVSHDDAMASAGGKSGTGVHDTMQKNDDSRRGEMLKKVELCGVCARPELTSGVGSFLRCRRCGCRAHIQCWFLQRLPSHVDSWQCPSCNIVKRESHMGRCCICGHRGGVMLPYVSGSDWKRQVSGTVTESRRAATATETSLSCHIICSLAFEELTVDPKHRVVHPIKRFKKAYDLGHCVLCHSNSLGACVKCHHRHCYERMHPVCAQLAGTLECYRSPKATTNNNGPWEGCHFYCRTHFGWDVSTLLGSARISEFAEAHALQQLTLEDCKSKNGGNSDTLGVQQPSQSRGKLTNAMMESVKEYWIRKRLKRLKEAGLLVKEIQQGQRDFASVILWPEIMKVAPTEVHLTRFLCLIPELQYHICTTVEGVLPIPDDEYDDVQEYRKVNQTRTRHKGDTVKLYEKMKLVDSHITLFSEVAELLHQRAITRRELVETELLLLEAQCKLDSGINIL